LVKESEGTTICGLFGLITSHNNTKLSPEQRWIKNKIVSGLAVAMQDRGHQSAGIAAVVSGTVEIVKKAISPAEFIALPEFDEVLNKNPKIVIGHTRLKTVGAIIDKNAHPFEHGRIIGAHNGSVSNWYSIYPGGDVDSEAIFWQLNEDKNDWDTAFPKLQGSMAITWLDKKNPLRAHLVRHNNPLYLAFCPEVESFVWCSTESALRIVFAATVGRIPEKIVEVPVDEVVSISNDLSLEYKKTNFGVYTPTQLPQPSNVGVATQLSQGKKFSKNMNWTVRDGVVDEFDERDRLSLQKGCASCNKAISQREPFFYRVSLSAVIHGRCLKTYSKYIKRTYNIDLPLFYLFDKGKHKIIREIIAKENRPIDVFLKERDELENKSGFVRFNQLLTTIH